MIKLTFMILVSMMVVMNHAGCRNTETNAQSQHSPPEVGANPVESLGPFQGSIETDAPLFLASGKSEEEKINQTSFGRLYLVFKDSDKEEFKTEVPGEAMLELNSYLRARLKYCSLNEPSDFDTAVERDMDLIRNANNTKNNLLRVDLDAPGGQRKISYEEAGKLIDYVGISTVDLCKSLKKE